MTLQHQKWKLPVAWRFERNINLTPCSSHRRTPSHTAKGTAELGRRGKLPPVPAKDDQPRVCHEGGMLAGAGRCSGDGRRDPAQWCAANVLSAHEPECRGRSGTSYSKSNLTVNASGNFGAGRGATAARSHNRDSWISWASTVQYSTVR